MLRVDRRLSQSALGRHAGLSGKFIGDVERGAKSISVDNLYRIAEALRLPLWTLTDFPGADGWCGSLVHHRIFTLLATPHRPHALARAYRVVLAMLGPGRGPGERRDRGRA